MTEPAIAVLLPCHNEVATIGSFVRGFREASPGARVYVFGNNSTDETASMAEAAGAIVRQDTLKGKGFVVRRMFRDIQADLYVIADGDDTYDASLAPAMIDLAGALSLTTGIILDMVTRGRQETRLLAYVQHAAPQPPSPARGAAENWALKMISSVETDGDFLPSIS